MCSVFLDFIANLYTELRINVAVQWIGKNDGIYLSVFIIKYLPFFCCFFEKQELFFCECLSSLSFCGTNSMYNPLLVERNSNALFVFC